jgi:hypothetical protein
MNAQSFRCPACHKLSHHEIARGATSVLLCEHCGHTVQTSALIAGDDGVSGVRPDPAGNGWESSFEAVYPNGDKRVLDLHGYTVREGEPVPGTNYLLERWEVIGANQ